MHDNHENQGAHEGNPWPDRINEAYYDKMGAEFGRQARDRINWMCSQARGTTVLDVGCSQGIAAVLLAREGFEVLGLDIFEPAIEYANKERDSEIESVRRRLTFRCGDLASLEAARYDTVIMGEVVEHQTNPVRFIRDAASRVAPGGRIVMTAPFGLHPWPDHKSSLFPRSFAEALGESFGLVQIDVRDGYVRVVADRDAGSATVEANAESLLHATESGAVAAQESYYAASADMQRLEKAKIALEAQLASLGAERGNMMARLDELASEMSRRVQQAASDAAAASRDLATSQSHLERYEELLREIAVQKTISEQNSRAIIELEAGRQRDQALIAQQQQDLQEAERVIVELKQSSDHVAAASEPEPEPEPAPAPQPSVPEAAYRQLEADIGRLRLQLAARREEVASLQQSEQSLQSQCAELKRELVVAQHKRSAHWAKLEAERERSAELIALAERLHHDNQLYQNSLALAIGRSLFGLASVRGIVRLPGTLADLGRRIAARRRNGGPVVAALQLPRLRPVHVPEPAEAKRDASPAPETKSAAELKVEEQKKKLSVAGWTQVQRGDTPPVLSVLDEFSRACFESHADLIEPRPDNWEGLVDQFSPQLLLVESAWRGNKGTWRYRVANYEYSPGRELARMVEGCRKRGIPTVLWNKEDPVHFDDFLPAARGFEYIFTTAAEAVPRYRRETSAKVDVLQFAAEESLHNPIGSATRLDKVCFAGSFYANAFDARREQQLMLLDAASEFDLDIFDRNHALAGAAKDPFRFPDKYAPLIRAGLSYDEVIRAYRGYRVFLNANSVVDSPTMFSRRVFELLACGTPVVSAWSRGTEETFGNDIVWHVRNHDEARDAIRVLLSDDREWRRRSLAGIRAVLSRHTYRHRFARVLEAIGQGTPTLAPFDNVCILAEVTSQADADSIAASFRRQEMDRGVRKSLVLLVRGDESVQVDDSDVSLFRTEASVMEMVSARSDAGDVSLVAVLSPRAIYGRHFVQDLAHASRYSQSPVVGKSQGGAASDQYQFGVPLDPASLMVNPVEAKKAGAQLADLLGVAQVIGYASDNANFARTQGAIAPAGHAEILSQIEF